MTDKEKVIVMAHTGICMLTGNKFQIFHKYVEDIMGRPIMTHEIGFLEDVIKEKSKTDFIALCAEQESKPGYWIDNNNGTISCSHCHTWFNKDNRYFYMRYCPYCNIKMVEPTCDTCEYNTAAFMPCNSCDDKSEYEPRESEVNNADSD